MHQVEQSEQFYPGMNLSYQSVKDRVFLEKNLKRASLIGTIIENCQFAKVDMAFCDIEGAKFNLSNFTDCKFNNTDIYSLWAFETTFYDCDFSIANIVDCTFKKCIFKGCIFDHSSINENTFTDCIFELIDIKSITSTLNKFNKTSFLSSNISKLFYYSLSEKCSYTDTLVDIDMAGFTHGIDIENFDHKNARYKIIDEVKEQYQAKGQFVNVGILNMNCHMTTNDFGIIACVLLFGEYIKRNMIVKSELIKFIDLIIQNLSDKNCLSPAAIIIAMEQLGKYQNKYDNISLEKSRRELLSLRNSLYIRYLHFVDSIHYKSSIEDNIPLIIKIKYSNKPEIDLVNILNAISPEDVCSYFLHSQHGSFIEWIASTSTVIPYLQTFLALLGIIVPIAIYSDSRKDNFTKDIVETRSNISITINLPQVYNSQQVGMINSAIKTIVTDGFLKSNNKHGYSNKNILEISVELEKDTLKPFSTPGNTVD